MVAHQSGSVVVSGEMLRLSYDLGRGRKLRYHELEHAMIDQADQAEPFGDRHDVGREQHAAVVLLHPHQAFVEGARARIRRDHRLDRP